MAIQEASTSGMNGPAVAWTTRLITLGFAGICAAVGWRWINEFRRGGLLDIDEAGYLSLAWGYLQSLTYAGPFAFVSAVLFSPSVQAPIASAAGALAMRVFGPDIWNAFLAEILSYFVIIVVTARLARAVGGEAAGLAAAVCIASAPVIVLFSRTFNFADPATAVTGLCLLALISSRHFASVPWALAFGLLLGLMPLTRTMTLGFIPGVIAAAVWAWASEQPNRSGRAVNLLLGLIVAIAVASLWLYGSGGLVFEYLLSFGYGQHAAEYGTVPPLSVAGAISPLLKLSGDLYLPHSIVLVAAMAFAAVSAVRRTKAGAWRSMLGSPAVPLAIFVLEGLAALASTQNKGSAFDAPLLPPVFALAAAALFSPRLARPMRWAAGALIALCFAVSFPPFANLSSPLADEVELRLPFLGKAVLKDGRGNLERYEAQNAGEAPGLKPISDATLRLLAEASPAIAEKLRRIPRSALIAFGFRHSLINVNTVNLANLMASGYAFRVTQIDPIAMSPTSESYTAWLTTGDAADACILLTARGSYGEFPLAADALAEEAAARALGFNAVETFETPHRNIVFWMRGAGDTRCMEP